MCSNRDNGVIAAPGGNGTRDSSPAGTEQSKSISLFSTKGLI